MFLKAVGGDWDRGGRWPRDEDASGSIVPGVPAIVTHRPMTAMAFAARGGQWGPRGWEDGDGPYYSHETDARRAYANTAAKWPTTRFRLLKVETVRRVMDETHTD